MALSIRTPLDVAGSMGQIVEDPRQLESLRAQQLQMQLMGQQQAGQQEQARLALAQQQAEAQQRQFVEGLAFRREQEAGLGTRAESAQGAAMQRMLSGQQFQAGESALGRGGRRTESDLERTLRGRLAGERETGLTGRARLQREQAAEQFGARETRETEQFRAREQRLTQQFETGETTKTTLAEQSRNLQATKAELQALLELRRIQAVEETAAAKGKQKSEADAREQEGNAKKAVTEKLSRLAQAEDQDSKVKIAQEIARLTAAMESATPGITRWAQEQAAPLAEKGGMPARAWFNSLFSQEWEAYGQRAAEYQTGQRQREIAGQFDVPQEPTPGVMGTGYTAEELMQMTPEQQAAILIPQPQGVDLNAVIQAKLRELR